MKTHDLSFHFVTAIVLIGALVAVISPARPLPVADSSATHASAGMSDAGADTAAHATAASASD